MVAKVLTAAEEFTVSVLIYSMAVAVHFLLHRNIGVYVNIILWQINTLI